MVVLLHLGGAIADRKYFGTSALATACSFGGAGVQFFFVLSGFIILHAHRDDLGHPTRLGRYVWKRVVRIYPAYWIVFAALLVSAALVPSLRHHVPDDLAVLIAAATLIPLDKRVVGGTGAPVLDVAWTLQYEVTFYAGFALLICSRKAGLALVALYVAMLAAYAGGMLRGFPATFLARPDMWLFGVGLGVAALSGRPTRGVLDPFHVVVAGAACFAATAAAQVIAQPAGGAPFVLAYGAASGLIVYGMARAEDAGACLLDHRAFQALGDASYALYLLHYPIIVALCKLAVHLGLERRGNWGAAIVFVASLASCIAAALIFHAGIERPIARALAHRAAPLGTRG